MGVGSQRHASAAFTLGKYPGPVWIGAENLAPTGIRSSDLPARSESLYRLTYSGPFMQLVPALVRGSQAAGAWRWPATPSSAEVKERVELYLYSPSGHSLPVLDKL